MKKYLFFLTFLVIAFTVNAQQKVIPLYKGISPGSENWNWTEGETYKNPLNTKIVYNVTQPTLIAYFPDPAVANGSAIIICLGGGFHVLLIDSVGTKLATELTKKGIAVFILKYGINLYHSCVNLYIHKYSN